MDRIALEKKREAGMPRRVTRITEPPPSPPHHRATLSLSGRHTGTEKNVCDLENSGWWK